MDESLPLVSVVTPVFNGEKYLRACIESVLAQTYTNIDYTIANNCSTDNTFKIAQEYAAHDSRVRVMNNPRFVGSIENHNIAVRSISPTSKYCKLLSADDWLFPECVSKLVEVAERNTRVGVVAAYAVNSNGINWSHLPIDQQLFDGRDICRRFLLGLIDYFWVPSAVLYRSSVVRSAQAFFPGSAPSADLEACLESLRGNDLGFVHQILSFERLHAQTTSHKVRELNSYLLDRIRILKHYGHEFLTETEFEARLDALLAQYYHVLAVAAFNFREREFWNHHQKKLRELGLPVYGRHFFKAVGLKTADLLLNPKQSFERLARRISARRAALEPKDVSPSL